MQGECKYTMDKDGHTDWVSCVRFPPATEDPVIVSCGWDKAVKVCVRARVCVCVFVSCWS